MPSQGNRRLSQSDIHTVVTLTESYSFRYVGRMCGISAQWVAELVANTSRYLAGNNLSTSILNLSSVFMPVSVELTT